MAKPTGKPREEPEEVTPKVKKRRPPARTVQSRENQLISLAIDVAEKQLRRGTASSQVITHFLKLATTREELEKEKLKKENLLLEAKAENLQSQKKIEDLYANALLSMQIYKGERAPTDEDD